MLDLTQPNCSRCIKRPVDDGGKASCPYLRMIVKGVPLYEKYAKQGDHNCGAYVAGTVKRRVEPTPPQEGLF
jgi:hypothetical protein